MMNSETTRAIAPPHKRRDNRASDVHQENVSGQLACSKTAALM
jgi:hypothetical protein